MPRHIDTWAYDNGLGGLTDGATNSTTNATAREHFRTWVDYGEASRPGDKAFLDCSDGGCIPVSYFDAFKKYDDCYYDLQFINAVSADEGAWYHQALPGTSSNRIVQDNAPGCAGVTTAWFPNGSNPSAQSYWMGYFAGYPPNAAGFSDDTGTACTAFDSTTPSTIFAELGDGGTCVARVKADHEALWSALATSSGAPLPIFYNGINPASAYQIQTDLDYLMQGQVLGAISEGFVVGNASGGTLYPRAVASILDTASLVTTQTTKALVMLDYLRSHTGPCTVGSYAWYTGCSLAQQRRLAVGLQWLMFKHGQTVLFEPTGTATQLQVFPEASIVPTQPLQTMSAFSSAGTNGTGCGSQASVGGAADLLVQCGALSDGTPSGVYRREFAQCFNFGTPIGPCAAVVNTTASAVTLEASWFTTSFTHALTFDPGDVLTAGCDNGPCPTSALDPQGQSITLGSSTVGAVDAVLLFP